ncbi:MAG: hypothetical protein WCI72_06515 [archaeon]
MAEETPKIILQREFTSLDDFVKNSNNFYLHFVGDSGMGRLYRTKDAFKRFQKYHLELEQETTRIVVSDVRDTSLSKWHGPITKTETWEKLIEAYKLMSQLVYKDDRDVKRPDLGKEFDDWFLCR